MHRAVAVLTRASAAHGSNGERDAVRGPSRKVQPMSALAGLLPWLPCRRPAVRGPYAQLAVLSACYTAPTGSARPVHRAHDLRITCPAADDPCAVYRMHAATPCDAMLISAAQFPKSQASLSLDYTVGGEATDIMSVWRQRVQPLPCRFGAAQRQRSMSRARVCASVRHTAISAGVPPALGSLSRL